MSFLDRIAANLGYISDDEALYRSLPANLKSNIENTANDLSTIADPNQAFEKQASLIQDILKHIPGGGAVSGYEAAGSVLRRRFPNSFTLHTFLAESHWAVAKARRHCITEFERDGYVLLADKRVNKKQVKKVQQALEDLGIAATWQKPAMRTEMFDHSKVYGNFWTVPNSNGTFGGTSDIELLLPTKLQPKYSKTNTDEIEAWIYEWNNKAWTIPVDAVDHVRSYSLSKKFIGTPALTSIVVDIEADLHASTYTNTMWQKGGLIMALVAMENPQGSSINENEALTWAMKLQELFARTKAGVKGGGQLMFTPSVKGVYPIINPKDLEGPYKETSERTAIKACELMGCPPEVLGLSRSSQYTNAAATLDFASLSVDNDNYYVASMVDRYITERVIEELLGIDGIYIQASGQFGATSKICAEFGLAIAKMGCDLMTINEFRSKILHWEPLEKGGDQFVGHVLNEALLMKAAKPATGSKERKEIFEEMLGPENVINIKRSDVEFIKYDPRVIKYW